MKFIALTIVALYGLSATFLNAQSVPFVIPGDDSSVSATDFFRLLDEPPEPRDLYTSKLGMVRSC